MNRARSAGALAGRFDREVTLGGFVLGDRLGSGGMGEVWRAHHPGRALDAAIKVVTQRDARFRDGLQAEIRAAASLDHPHIVRLFDAGVVNADAAAASDDRLTTDDPWFAMEVVDGGSVLGTATDWISLRRSLRELLAALGHAHARGFIHCDLKPDNALIDRRSGRLVLCDFGIARFVHQAGDVPRASGGTPLWMAPEQFLDDPAWLGPWTDLYTFGCIAWRLVTGHPPFVGRGLQQLMREHLHQPMPPLVPTFPVPATLEAWIRKLADKDPGRRFRRAADALLALDELPDFEQTVPIGPPPLGTLVPASTELLPTEVAPLPPGSMLDPSPPAPARVPPMAPDWRATTRPTRKAAANELGLGLFRLRERPLVGRERHRDRLWRALRDAAEGKPRVVLLEGEPGCGKSSLARWLGETAHAAGVAGVTWGVGRDGIEGLVRRAVGAASVEVEGLREYVERRGFTVPAELVRLITSPTDGVTTPVPNRLSIALRALADVAEGRISVIVVDDAHDDVEFVALARLALSSQRRVLFLWTVRSDLVAQEPELDEALAGLLECEGAERIEVARLDDESLVRLLSTTIPLSEELLTAVASRAEGNPLFAEQIVADWIDRGVLRPHDDRWEMAPRTTLPVPIPLRAVWMARARAALEGLPNTLESLEIAAALGPEVDGSEWFDGCVRASVPVPPPGLLIALVNRGLATPDTGSRGLRWRFAHGLLAASLVAGARDPVRLHVTCAEVLASRGPQTSARRARHLEHAGRTSDAVDAWCEARIWFLDRDLAVSLRAARRAAELSELLDADDRRRAFTWLGLARVHRARCDLEARESALDRAMERAQRGDDPALTTEIRSERAWMLYESGRKEEGRAEAAQAASDMELLVGPGRFSILVDLGILLVQEGHLAAGEPLMTAALEIAPSAVPAGEVLACLALVAAGLGRTADAAARLEESRKRLFGVDAPLAEATWHYVAGQIAAGQGKKKDAVFHARRSVELRFSQGSRPLSWVVLWANYESLGGTPTGFAEALSFLEEAERSLPQVLAIRIVAAARLGELDEATTLLDALAATTSVEHRVTGGEMLEEAGDRLAPSRPESAKLAWRLARSTVVPEMNADVVERLDAKLSGRVRIGRG